MRFALFLTPFFVITIAKTVYAQRTEASTPLAIPPSLKCSVAEAMVTLPKEVMLSISQNPLRIRVYEVGKKTPLIRVQEGLIEARGNAVKEDEMTTCEILKNDHTENAIQFEYARIFYPYGAKNGLARGRDIFQLNLFRSAHAYAGNTVVVNSGGPEPWNSYRFIKCENS